MMQELNIAIGLPCNWDFINIQFFESWVELKKPKHSVIIGNRGRVDDQRNSIIHAVLKDGSFSHILFLDTDHKHHPDTIPKLLSHDKLIVSGLSFRRSEPYDPIMFKEADNKFQNITEWEENELLEVDAIGAASLLVRTEVFQKMNTNKWFEMNYAYGNGVISEDFAFCLRARNLGYKIYCDTSCTNSHLGQLNVTQDTWIKNGRKVNDL